VVPPGALQVPPVCTANVVPSFAAPGFGPLVLALRVLTDPIL
jgi:hypothetical protein